MVLFNIILNFIDIRNNVEYNFCFLYENIIIVERNTMNYNYNKCILGKVVKKNKSS